MLIFIGRNRRMVGAEIASPGRIVTRLKQSWTANSFPRLGQCPGNLPGSTSPATAKTFPAKCRSARAGRVTKQHAHTC